MKNTGLGISVQRELRESMRGYVSGRAELLAGGKLHALQVEGEGWVD